MRAWRAAAVSAALATVLAGAGCYKPNIKPGGLACGAKNACPDGFQCDINHAPPVCVSGGPGGATGTGMGGKGGTGGSATGGQIGTGGQTGAGGGGGTGGVVCLPPMSGCTSNFVDGGACDPVCNVGCASCDQKCSVNMAGAMTCNPPMGTPPKPNEECQVVQPSSNPATQTDNCPPGQVCIEPTTCGALCYQFCRTDSDCSSKRCGRDVGNGMKACDVPYTQCDPTSTQACDSAAIQTRCYLSAENGRTLCDCPSYTKMGRLGETCVDSRDCIAGLVCYNKTGKVDGRQCVRVCRLPTDGGAPDAGFTCATGPASCWPIALPTGQTTTWGYCNE